MKSGCVILLLLVVAKLTQSRTLSIMQASSPNTKFDEQINQVLQDIQAKYVHTTRSIEHCMAFCIGHGSDGCYAGQYYDHGGKNNCLQFAKYDVEKLKSTNSYRLKENTDSHVHYFERAQTSDARF